MGCAHKQNQNGFTLVEIAIVMIIIGLLVGGTFGGMKLIENMQVNRTVQDLKAIESAGLTFKDTFGRLPGDIVNPAARLPNCATAPCATGGNGNRRLDPINTGVEYRSAITATMEKFTFWSHLQAADLVSLGTKNTTDMNFGEGQPNSPVGGGYRMTEFSGVIWTCGKPYQNAILMIINVPSADMWSDPNWSSVPCNPLRSIDQKMDDGIIHSGKFVAWDCAVVNTGACNDVWNPQGTGNGWYDPAF